MEADDGLADYLLSEKVLNAEQNYRITKGYKSRPYEEQNRELIDILLISVDPTPACTSFIAALLETNQKHVVNFLHTFEGLKMRMDDS